MIYEQFFYFFYEWIYEQLKASVVLITFPTGHGWPKYGEWNKKKQGKRAPTASLKFKTFFANEQ